MTSSALLDHSNNTTSQASVVQESTIFPADPLAHATSQACDVNGNTESSSILLSLSSQRRNDEDSSLVQSINESTQFSQCRHIDWTSLRFHAAMLNDIQKTRQAVGNRQWAGNSLHVLDVEMNEALMASALNTEEQFAKALTRVYKQVVPDELQAWQKAAKGVGDLQFARLLGEIGDPFIATPYSWSTTPPKDHVCLPLQCGKERHLVAGVPFYRTLPQLWQYCGLGDPNRRVTKNITAEGLMALGKPQGKVLMHRIVAQVVMAKRFNGEYAVLYDAIKNGYVSKTHESECKRCGPSGKPAQPGSSWSPGHQDAAAKRYVAKEILRDIYTIRKNAVLGLMPSQSNPLLSTSVIAQTQPCTERR